MEKLLVDHKMLSENIVELSVDDLKNLYVLFFVFSYDENYVKSDMRKACNTIVSELRKRGFEDEKFLRLEEDENV